MNPTELKLFYEPKDRLRLTIGEDRSYPTVKPVWASPQSHPKHYLGLLDGKEKEITTIADPNDLPEASLGAVLEELNRRYLTATIVSIANAKVEFGATYWHVITNRGERDFVTQSLQENAIWISPAHILLIDVDGNRFEIPDIAALDEKSKATLNWIV